MCCALISGTGIRLRLAVIHILLLISILVSAIWNMSYLVISQRMSGIMSRLGVGNSVSAMSSGFALYLVPGLMSNVSLADYNKYIAPSLQSSRKSLCPQVVEL